MEMVWNEACRECLGHVQVLAQCLNTYGDGRERERLQGDEIPLSGDVGIVVWKCIGIGYGRRMVHD